MVIDEFTTHLPGKLSELVTREFQYRHGEVNYMIQNYDQFKELYGDRETIKTLLSLSIFYKRVISNIDSAEKFSGRIFNADGEAITIGRYVLDKKQSFRISRFVLTFRRLLTDYSISPEVLFNYQDTWEFLKKIKQYKQDISNQGTNGESV